MVPLVTFGLVSCFAGVDALLVRDTSPSFEPVAGASRVAPPERAPAGGAALDAALPDPLESIGRPPLIEVRIARSLTGDSIRFRVDGPYHIHAAPGDANGRLLAAGERLASAWADARSGQVRINGVLLPANRVEITPGNAGTLDIDGTSYHGSLLLEAGEHDRLAAGNRVDLEEYVCGVLLSEMPERFGQEALRAQAVIARTFALYQIRQGKLLRDDQGSQVYTGLQNVSEPVRRLVRSTVGEVLTFEERLIESYFHSTCGGVTSSALGIFNIPEEPPLQGGVICRSCRHSPHYRWTREISSERLSDLFAGAFGNQLNLAITERLPSGRARTVALLDAAGTELDRLQADRFRNMINAGRPLREQLPSMLIQGISRRASSLRIEGRGFGHGVGLCQYGAGGLARLGAGYREILSRYYPGAAVRRLYE